jgi:hypothetical protein
MIPSQLGKNLIVSIAEKEYEFAEVKKNSEPPVLSF